MSDDQEDAGGDIEDVAPAEGRYANYFRVGHNAFEFLLDFSQFYADSTEARGHTRIITSPAYAKALSEMLRESIRRYEEAFGPIEDDAGRGHDQ